MNISQTKLLKPLSVHEYTHQMQTYCERKKIHGTVPLRELFLQCQQVALTPSLPHPVLDSSEVTGRM